MFTSRPLSFFCLPLILLIISTQIIASNLSVNPLSSPYNNSSLLKNVNRPIFANCTSYKPKVKEAEPNGTYVITVKATDQDDADDNESIQYSLVQWDPNEQNTKFVVDKITGEIKTNIVFDREGDDGRFVSVTVKVGLTENSVDLSVTRIVLRMSLGRPQIT